MVGNYNYYLAAFTCKPTVSKIWHKWKQLLLFIILTLTMNEEVVSVSCYEKQIYKKIFRRSIS